MPAVRDEGCRVPAVTVLCGSVSTDGSSAPAAGRRPDNHPHRRKPFNASRHPDRRPRLRRPRRHLARRGAGLRPRAAGLRLSLAGVALPLHVARRRAGHGLHGREAGAPERPDRRAAARQEFLCRDLADHDHRSDPRPATALSRPTRSASANRPSRRITSTASSSLPETPTRCWRRSGSARRR